MPSNRKVRAGDHGATVGYEAELWQMADALRGSMDAAEYKHVVLGPIFLKSISDAFEEPHAKLVAEQAQGADTKDPDEYRGGSRSCVGNGDSFCRQSDKGETRSAFRASGAAGERPSPVGAEASTHGAQPGPGRGRRERKAAPCCERRAAPRPVQRTGRPPASASIGTSNGPAGSPAPSNKVQTGLSAQQ